MARDMWGRTMLHLYIIRQVEMNDVLIDMLDHLTVDQINQVCQNGNTALHYAANLGTNPSIVLAFPECTQALYP